MFLRIRTSFMRIGAITLTLASLLSSMPAPRPAGAATYITDAAVHAPPTSGAYAYAYTYGAFGPDSSSFPRVGQTFVDPVFGGTIRRLTNDLGSYSDSEIYSKNGYFNADGSLMYHRSPDAHTIINTSSGQVVRSGVAFNAESSFAPDNPDAWYTFTKGDTTLYRYSVSTGTRTVVTTFPGALGELGGSVDWIDRTGRYMVLHVGGSTRVYDRQTDSLYAGNIPGSYGGGGGWRGISPDGNYVITSSSGSPTPTHSWRIDHANKRVNTTPVLFWTLCGGHGDVVSASNGKTYYVTFDCNTTNGIYRVDVSLPQSSSNVSQQLSQNKKLVQPASWSDHGHFSRVSKGALRDWVFASIESGDDGFSSSVSGWRPYKQEILMMNVLTGEVRRLAHHRSRGLSSSYFAQPRVSATWDGRIVAWASNFGYDDTGYADIYALTVSTVSGTQTPGGGTGGGTGVGTTSPALAVSFSNPASGAVLSGTVTVSVQGSGGSGSGYRYTVNAASSPSVQIYSGTNGTVSWNTTNSPNGPVMLSATVTDAAGKTATATRSVRVSNPTAGTPTNGTSVSITTPSSGVWTGNSIQVGATASGGSLARLELWGAGKAFATIPCSGTSCTGSARWTTGPLAPAAYQVNAVAVSTTGARTVSAPVTINKDATSPPVVSGAGSNTAGGSTPTGGTPSGTPSGGTPPSGTPSGGTSSGGTSSGGTSSGATTVSISTPGTGVWTGNSIGVGATASGGSLARLELWGAGKAFATIPCNGASCSGSARWITGPLAPAAYQVTAVAVDTSGARTVSAPVTINKDATAPVITSGASGGPAGTGGSKPPTGGVTGGTTGDATPPTGGATGGTTGDATPPTGGATGATMGDATAPTVAITSPRSGVWTGNSLLIAVSATDNAALRDIRLSADGTQFGTVPCSGTSCSGSVWWLSGPYPSGTHTVTAIATDQAGNTRNTSITVSK